MFLDVNLSNGMNGKQRNIAWATTRTRVLTQWLPKSPPRWKWLHWTCALDYGCTVECVGSGEELKRRSNQTWLQEKVPRKTVWNEEAATCHIYQIPLKRFLEQQITGRNNLKRIACLLKTKRYQTIVTSVVQVMTTTLIKHFNFNNFT